MLNGNTNRHQYRYLFKSKFFSTQRYKMSLFLREKKYTEPALIQKKYGTGTNRIVFFLTYKSIFILRIKNVCFFIPVPVPYEKVFFRLDLFYSIRYWS